MPDEETPTLSPAPPDGVEINTDEPTSDWKSDMAAEVAEVTGMAAPPPEAAPAPVADPPSSEDPPPAETPVPEPAPEQAAEPDILESLPDENPKPTDWKIVRERLKELKAEVATLKAPPTEVPVPEGVFDPSILGLTPPPAPAAPQQEVVSGQEFSQQIKQPDVPQLSARDAFVALAHIETTGDGEESKPIVEAAITALDPREVIGIIDSARAGAFGESSDDIVTMARERLPEIQARFADRQVQQQQVTDFQTTREQSMGRVGETFVGKSKGDPEVVAFVEAGNDLAQRLPALQFQADAPEVIQEYARLRQQDQLATKLQAENADLRQRLNGSGPPSPLPSGSQQGSEKIGGNWKTDMREELSEMGLA